MELPPKEFTKKMADWVLEYGSPGTYEGYRTISRLAWDWMQEHAAGSRENSHD